MYHGNPEKGLMSAVWNYRPMSITSVVCKMTESIIRYHIVSCSSSSSVVSAFASMFEVPGSIPTMAVDLHLLALSRVVAWSPEVPSYCSSRLSACDSKC